MPSDVPRWKSGRGYSGRGISVLLPLMLFLFLIAIGSQQSAIGKEDVRVKNYRYC